MKAKGFYGAAAVLWILGGCHNDTPPPRRGADRPVPVHVEAVRRGALSQSLDFVGELAARESVQLASKVAGRLRRVKVRMGERVSAGEVLAEIDDAQVRAQYQEAKAALSVAKASLLRAQVEDQNAAVELARKEPLAAKDLVTRQELDNVRTKRSAAAASLELGRAQVAQAQARLQLLAQQLADARVTTPFEGWVEARHLDPGAVVNAGTAILKLVRTDPIVARFQVPERDVGEIRRRLATGPLEMTLALDAYPRERFVGAVTRVAPAIDPKSRSAALEAELQNADGRLMPGMYGRVRLDLGSIADALLLPLDAVVGGTRSGAREVPIFLVEGTTAKRVRVTLGYEEGGYGELLTELRAGQRVIVAGHRTLKDGAAVEVVRERQPAADPGASLAPELADPGEPAP